MSEAMNVSSLSSPSMPDIKLIVQVRNHQAPSIVQISPKQSMLSDSLNIGLNSADLCVTQVNALETTVKNIYRLIEIGSELQVLTSVSLNRIVIYLKDLTDLFDSVKFVALFKTLFCPQTNGKYFFFDEKRTNYEKAERSFLMGHLACKTAHALNKWNLIKLGKVATAKIGQHLPIFQVVTDGLISISSLFTVYGCSKDLQDYTNKRLTLKQKLKSWRERTQLIEQVMGNDPFAIEKLRNIWLQKLESYQPKIVKLQQEFISYPLLRNEKKLIKLQKAEKKLEQRLKLIEKSDYQALAKDLSQADMELKIEKIIVKEEELETNRKINLANIAACVSRIFVIAMAFAFVAFNLTAVLPVVTLLACGIIADSIGLVKIAMEHFRDEKKQELIA